MGQHKYNPTAQAASRGELPPKPVPMGAAESRRRIMRALEKKTGLDKIYRALGPDSCQFY